MFSSKHIFLFNLINVLIIILFINGCGESEGTNNPPDINNTVELKIYYTNDEHGWLESANNYNGAAGLITKWKNDHGYNKNDENNLVISGGDMWTGPAISTWFKGESMAAIMNAMGYDAAAIGNHEFDFTQTGLRERLNQSNFPFLAANLRNETGGYPDFVKPYIIKFISGIKVAILGLTTSSVITINFPDNVRNLQVISYQNALDEVVPQARAEGAELLVLTAHVPSSEMRGISGIAQAYGISVVGCGHSHNTFLEQQNDFVLFEAASNMTKYVFVTIQYDTLENSIESITSQLYDNVGDYSPDPEIQGIVSSWQNAMNNELSEVIGYTQTGISRSSNAIKNLIADSWLVSYPEANISLSNYGGVRQDIPAGDITIATIVGVLPFDNNIIKLELTGSEIKSTLSGSDLFAGGLNVSQGYILNDGSTLDDNTSYSVLITDYLYYTSNTLPQYDPTPEITNTNWRNPVIDWIRSLYTSITNPLENYLDNTPRRQGLKYIF